MKNILLIIILVLGTQAYHTGIFAQDINKRPDIRATEDLHTLEYYFAFTEATKHFMFGNYIQAVSLYNECLKLKPTSSAVYYQLSRIFLNSGNAAIAREYIKKAILYDDSSQWYLQNLAEIYQIEEKFDSAVFSLQSLRKIDPENLNYLVNIAGLYEKLEEFDKALSYLDSIDKRIGISKEISVKRYRILEKKGQYKAAEIALVKAYLLSEDDYIIAGMIAEFYRNRQLSDSAFKYYRMIYPSYKDDPVVAFSYGEFLLEQKRTVEARSVLLDIMGNKGVDQMVKSGYFVKVMQDNNIFKLTQPVLDTIVSAFYSAHKSDMRALSIYADIEVRIGNFESAVSALKNIIQIDKSNYLAYEQLIYVFNVLGKKDSVLFYSNEALEKFSDRPLLLLFNGSAKFQDSAYYEASLVLEKGIVLTKENDMKLEFVILLAECYERLKEYEKSEFYFNQAIKLDASNLLAKNNYAYYLSLREKNLKLAKKLSMETLKKEPENSTYLDTYAWILLKMNKKTGAKKFILRALQYGGEKNKDIVIHAGEIFLANKKLIQAMEYFRKATQLVDSLEKETLLKRITIIENQLN